MTKRLAQSLFIAVFKFYALRSNWVVMTVVPTKS